MSEAGQPGGTDFPDLTSAPEETLTSQALGKFLLDDQAGYDAPDNVAMANIDNVKTGNIGKNKNLLKSDGVQQRVLKVKAAENPLLEAVQPLLRVLSDMPGAMSSSEQPDVLKEILKNEINLFSVVCDEVEISWKKMAIVRYCICTALDEAALTTSWGAQWGWSQSNILNHFEGDNDGGNKFFLLVGRLSMNPHEYVDVLEILLRILGLGFEGRYSILEDGDRQLTKIRQRLLTIIQSTKDSMPAALSPHGQATRDKVKKERLIIPIRVTFLLTSVLVISTYIWCKYWLSRHEINLQQRIYAMQRINIIKQPAVPRLRLAILLKEEIKRELVSVDETQAQSKVVIRGDSIFLSGSEKVLPDMEPLLKRIAKEVHRVNGKVVIVGHTDSIPVRTKAFPDNKTLSEKRAAWVARYFIAEGIEPKKIISEGVGDTQPVSSNKDNQGRAQNRRVEFFVTY
ncbi:type VI secretion system protein TssL, long form [Erwinia tracheiphila]|uniref:Type VI secretion system protein TssL n=1 Tax=Erwinia tracheiphila TaxID=65700 RepID=A0A345CVY0_9GAMM|nr:type VI secretion system protein TssL, long form [Erwinia tracheiphila]AXF77597.1 type VI secretion system protein TssL [Erwinia tracheiphila]UIA83720.1 type VI secretion system protein TssL, long form [Erwinia tracheiphila]UIA92302.1 type VI secretion system protein TssL, long form [Erwinia tracheiphila]